MSASKDRQKELEREMLEAARRASSLFPDGEIAYSNEPDLRLLAAAGEIGVEVTELIRSKGTSAFPPVQDEAFHHQVVRLAEVAYTHPSTLPVCVRVYFLDEDQCKSENPDGWRRLTDSRSGTKRDKMVRSLVDFVKRHPVPNAAAVTFGKREMPGQHDEDTIPTGYEIITISVPPGPWHSNESATLGFLEEDELAATIKKKHVLLPTYRRNAPNIPLWLLIYSSITVAKGVPIPPSIDAWRFPFGFDHVLLYSGMDNKVFEIRRS